MPIPTAKQTQTVRKDSKVENFRLYSLDLDIIHAYKKLLLQTLVPGSLNFPDFKDSIESCGFLDAESLASLETYVIEAEVSTLEERKHFKNTVFFWIKIYFKQALASLEEEGKIIISRKSDERKLVFCLWLLAPPSESLALPKVEKLKAQIGQDFMEKLTKVRGFEDFLSWLREKYS